MKILLIIMFFFMPIELTAQEFRVRSGEHGEFTRLVVDLPVLTKWELSGPTAENIYLLKFDVGPKRINTEDVFERIDRRRVQSVRAVPQGLELAVGCNCLVEAFVFSETMLVLDISDSSDEGVDIEKLQGAGPLTFLEFDDGASIGPRNRKHEEPLSNQPQIMTWQSGISAEFQASSTIRQNAPATAPSFDGRMGNSAERDDIFPFLTIQSESNDVIQDLAQERGHGNSSREMTEVSVSRAENGIVVASDYCVDADLLSIEEWASEAPFHVQLATHRESISMSEGDAFVEAVENMIKLYLHFGLGAEARSVQRAFFEKPNEIWEALADIIDGNIGQESIFSRQRDCDPPAGLWGILAGAEGGALHVDINKLVESFERMPLHLRKIVGPKLVERLSEEGRQSEVEVILSHLSRILDGAPDLLVLKAQNEIRLGEFQKAGAFLSDAWSSDMTDKKEIVAHAARLAIENSEPLAREHSGLVEAFGVEARGSELEYDFWIAKVKSYVDERRLLEAARLIKAHPDVPIHYKTEALKLVFDSAMSEFENLEFLNFILKIDNELLAGADDESLFAIADRLIELSLPAKALAYLDSRKFLDRKKWQLISARAYLEGGFFQEAARHLRGLSGPESESVMSEISRRRLSSEFSESDDISRIHEKGILPEFGRRSHSTLESRSVHVASEDPDNNDKKFVDPGIMNDAEFGALFLVLEGSIGLRKRLEQQEFLPRP